MEIEKKMLVIRKETVEIDLSTDDMEDIIRKQLKLSANAVFNWYVGQWVSLSIKDEKVIEQGE